MYRLMRPVWLATAAWVCAAQPSPDLAEQGIANVSRIGVETNAFAQSPALDIENRADRVELRIMPFGASIMSGWGSSTKDGLRKYLRDALRKDGWQVDMVGTLSRGEMKDNVSELGRRAERFCKEPDIAKDHEAVPGDIIMAAESRLENAIGYKPNVVIINLGTNDAVRDVKVPEAGKRMENVLSKIWNADGMSKTCVLLSTLIPTNNRPGATNRLTINSQYRDLVKKLSKEHCIYLADMAPNGEEWFHIPADFLPTENPHVHPNDQGHTKMAAVFYQALNKAASDGKLAKPEPFEESTKEFCDKFEGTGKEAGQKTQRGSGYDDSWYDHDSKEMGTIWKHESEWDRNQWRFARLFHSRYDDLVAWIDNDDDKPNVYATWANSADGKGKFTMIPDMHSDISCDADGVNFLDMNGDGLDDLVCLDEEGNAYLSINRGDGDAGARKPPSFKYQGLIKNTETTKRRYVVLGDIDGDGRGDYGIVQPGEVFLGQSVPHSWWRNGWVDDKPKYWQPLGFHGEGPSHADLDEGKTIGIYQDINGDGRDDKLWLADWGAAGLQTNSRSCRKTHVGQGLNVAWRGTALRGQTTGTPYLGVGDYSDPPGVQRYHFARIYGESSSFGNLAKKDYVYMHHEKSHKKHHFEMRVWKNLGHGGTKIKVDGNKYCNMMGHDDGRMDYVWTFQGGKMEIFINRGKKEVMDDDPDGFWEPKGTIWEPPRGMHRKDLHLADWDGDGTCDIIYVDPDKENAIEVWLNKKPGSWEWEHLSNPAPAVKCSQKRGVGIHDLAVRFADLTGNRRADYLCIEPNGRVSAFLHPDKGSAWENAGQIKFEEGKDRANLRWADVDGDGLDDMLWIEKFSGDTWVWYNGGRGSPSTGGGSSFYWRRQEKKAYAGLAAGTCLFYPDLNGDGRADEHYVLESFNNIAHTSLSPSCGLTDAKGDDANMDSNLPTPPATHSEHCIEGSGPEGLAKLCDFTCKFDYCISPCGCTKTGDLNTAPGPDSKPGKAKPGQPGGTDKLCAFACSRHVCPPEACVPGEKPSDVCRADPQKASSWEDTGAASMVDNYINTYGNDDWLRGADVLYNLGSGESTLNCDSITSKHCPGPDHACSDWKQPSFWYVRSMMTSINEHFTYASKVLTSESIRKLGLVDKMIEDFKTEVPAEADLKKILSNLSGGAGLASSLIGQIPVIGGIGATIFSLLGGAASLANVDTKAKPIDLNAVKADSKAYVIAVLDATNDMIEKTLPAFFGNAKLDVLTKLYDKLVDAKIVKASYRTTPVGRVLDGGEFMVPVLQSEIADALEAGIKGTMAALVGHLLAGLHYMIVDVGGYADIEDCEKNPACVRVPTTHNCPQPFCPYTDYSSVYLVRRPKGHKSSETVPKEVMDKLKNKDTYGIDVDAMFKNVKDCNNKQKDKGGDTNIYLGTEKYPPCYFGLAYIEASEHISGTYEYPIKDPKNLKDLPEWIGHGKDEWRDYEYKG